MNDKDNPKAEDLASCPIKHAYILGAGATKALYGDLRDKTSMPEPPLMKDFIERLNLSKIFKKHRHVPTSENIEEVYAEIDSQNKNGMHDLLIDEIQHEIWSHFMSYNLPENEVTIYDKLICSLDPNSTIFSFNWDPLLIQAFRRNAGILTRGTPDLIFLHGNVGSCYCEKCRIVLFNSKDLLSTEKQFCRKCRSGVKKHDLLYPVENKDYDKTLLLKSNWKDFDRFFSIAQIVTIFGYSAPPTDARAKEVITNAFRVQTLVPRDFNIIDTENEKILKDRWSHLVPDNYQYGKIFQYFDDPRNPIISLPRMFNKFFLGGYIMCEPYPGQEILTSSKVQALKNKHERTKLLEDYHEYIQCIEENLTKIECGGVSLHTT